MKTKVWLSLLIISSLLCTACANAEPVVEAEPQIPLEQDTLGMVPDFSYAITPQIPHIYIDQMGYRTGDKKMAFFYGEDLEETFEIRDNETEEVVYTGKLRKVKELEDKNLYVGDFSSFAKEGSYTVCHSEIGDSYEVIVDDSIYDRQFLVLQKCVEEYTYTNVSDFTYILANLMFIQELFADARVDSAFVEEKIGLLLNSQDAKSGAFFSEIFENPAGVTEPTQQAGVQQMGTETAGTISLTATAQMSGLLAQYSVLYKDSNPAFAAQCLAASQKAYKYMEKYRGNTDTDAWYYAAVQLFRATGQYKYRNAINEYDALDSALKSSTNQGYTVLADFAYLSTTYGTDYARCTALLDQYMSKAQNISVNSSRENFYVLENIDTMSDDEILDAMMILGVANYVLSGQEFAGIQRNYIHYLSGVNMEAKNFLLEEMADSTSPEGINITNISKLLVIFGNMYVS